MTAVLNAANEVAVGAFLGHQITFKEIPELINEVMNIHSPKTGKLDLDEILEADSWARDCTMQLINRLSKDQSKR
jgi:1-deoxy-D-xylulose-5-phosphate reductoisomerase